MKRFRWTFSVLMLGTLLACGGGDSSDQAPAPPSDVKSVAGAGFVTVSWTHDGQRVDSFNILRGATPTTSSVPGMTQVATVPASARSYQDEDVDPGTVYHYAVTAASSSGSTSEPAMPTDEEGVSPEPTEPGVTAISVSPMTANLDIGQTQQFTATVSAVGGASQNVTWSTGDPDIAVVDVTGLVTAMAEGSTTVIATSDVDPSVSGSAEVVVTGSPPPPGPPAATLGLRSIRPLAFSGPFRALLDASQSTSPSVIVQYVFDPGDGSGLIYEGGPGESMAEHPYQVAGNYTATVTLTNAAGESDTATVQVELDDGLSSWTWDDGFHLIDATSAHWPLDPKAIWSIDGGIEIAYTHMDTGDLVQGTVTTEGTQGEVRLHVRAQDFPPSRDDAPDAMVRHADGLTVLSWIQIGLPVEPLVGFFEDGDVGQAAWATTLEGAYRGERMASVPSGGVVVAGQSITPCPPNGDCYSGRVDHVAPGGDIAWTTEFPTSVTEEQRFLNWMQAATVSPDGEAVYVIGHHALEDWTGRENWNFRTETHYAVIAELTPGGSIVWLREIELFQWDSTDPSHAAIAPALWGVDVEVSGDTVYAAFQIRSHLAGQDSSRPSLLLAVDASTGEELWSQTLFSPGRYIDPIDIEPVQGGDAIFLMQTNAPIFERPVPGDGEAIMRRYTRDGSAAWTRQHAYSTHGECRFNSGHLNGFAIAEDNLYLMASLTYPEAVHGMSECDPLFPETYHPVIWRLPLDAD